MPLSNSERALLTFVERVERLEEEKAGLAEDIKEVYGEAAEAEFDAATMKKAIAARRNYQGYVTKRKKVDAMLDTLDQIELRAKAESEAEGTA